MPYKILLLYCMLNTLEETGLKNKTHSKVNVLFWSDNWQLSDSHDVLACRWFGHDCGSETACLSNLNINYKCKELQSCEEHNTLNCLEEYLCNTRNQDYLFVASLAMFSSLIPVTYSEGSVEQFHIRENRQMCIRTINLKASRYPCPTNLTTFGSSAVTSSSRTAFVMNG